MQMDFSHGDLTILQINVDIYTDAYVTYTEKKKSHGNSNVWRSGNTKLFHQVHKRNLMESHPEDLTSCLQKIH